MRGGMRFIVVLLLLTGTAHAADRLPKDMLGRWASDPAACAEQSSELGMTVEPRSILFYEHSQTVRTVSRMKGGALKVSGYSVDLDGRLRSSLTLKLVGNQLQVGEQTYHRCEKHKGSRAQ
jgi:hypothetical protein